MHLLEAGSTKVLLDCGLFQGRKEEARQRNARFPFQPRHVAAVLVSHAHIDHAGNLPTLIRQGFHGPIYCTPPTRDLLSIMLGDSAKIQEEDAAHLNIQRHYAEPFVEPLYTHTDVSRALSHVTAVEYDRFHEIRPGIRFKFLEAGHILGSAMVHVVIDGDDGERALTFTGDLGRRALPLLRRTAAIPPADVLVCESTYGDRVHEPIDETARRLFETINRTIERGGKVLIPAFSLGRTQLVIDFIHKGILTNRIPRIPIYVDSPLAADISGVYESHPQCLDDEGRQMLADGVGILGGDIVTYIRDFEDSIRISRRPDPCIVIAASGMCDAGRILHHLKEHVDDPRCTVILVSYQAYGTTGRRLLEKSPTVKFLGKDWNKWAEIVHLDGFSSHADRSDFMAYLSPLAGQVHKIRLIHGEREQAEALATGLRELGFNDVGVPSPGDVVVLE
jgi:metallo-beta-lactamase family protein